MKPLLLVYCVMSVRSFSYRPVACSQHGIVTLEIPQEHVQAESLLCVLTREGSGRAMSEREVALLRVNSVSRDGCSAEIAEVTDVNAEWNVVIRVK